MRPSRQNRNIRPSFRSNLNIMSTQGNYLFRTSEMRRPIEDPEFYQVLDHSFAEMANLVLSTCIVWCILAYDDVKDILYEVATTWAETPGDKFNKFHAANRVVIFYVLIITIEIINICFWIDQKLFKLTCHMILRAKPR